ncbi:ATP-binding cassette domain-containing protein [Archaeoglobus veneficus]|uniref:Daunorubicin resistance ABC transporter ATPase subunit n=1 Tax=Archaeoglobus veneficus (strain DSM 11195 / SNP6) TaxID=693661 RepID=F2KQJ7_ARCVS|nr:ATP-binding cassette domain-containing protein [Archaeoglobus veneficus]AEA47730.1 daunorubicin resistance ABC transporter ATPase subunit [Archaeoglobus veneficus SNP6]
MAAISVQRLTKDFNGFRAVDSVSFDVFEGEIFGLLGPNGAGKTTTVKMLVTLLKPTSGRATVAGYDVVRQADEVRKRIGIVFQEPTLDLELTAKENLDFHGRLYGMSKEERRKRIKEVLELVELEDRANVQVKKFSGGMQRRLEIARGLMHEPEILFLDEPTLGLDAQTRRKIWEYIESLKRKGVTVVLTTHYIEEAERLCDRVAIIDSGKIIALGTPNELKRSIGGDMLTFEIEGSEKGVNFDIGIAENVIIQNGVVEMTVKNGEETIPVVIEHLQREGVRIKSVNLRRPTLEDVFINLTGRKMREDGEEWKFWLRMRRR